MDSKRGASDQRMQSLKARYGGRALEELGRLHEITELPLPDENNG